MPMKLEAWPGGRRYRDLGDNDQEADATGNLRAAVHVQGDDEIFSIG
jgi:hypothetical protein